MSDLDDVKAWALRKLRERITDDDEPVTDWSEGWDAGWSDAMSAVLERIHMDDFSDPLPSKTPSKDA